MKGTQYAEPETAVLLCAIIGSRDKLLWLRISTKYPKSQITVDMNIIR
jgi:hypothetical protein